MHTKTTGFRQVERQLKQHLTAPSLLSQLILLGHLAK